MKVHPTARYSSVFYTAVMLIVVGFKTDAAAQNVGPKHELRGAWIATVINLDWPREPCGACTQAQKDELASMMRKLHGAGINAVFFQIRSESDAMYDSDIEPWSYWLTGQQGSAPDPYYDPLEYAIELAHGYGMELHAWMNPFRVQRDVGSYSLDETHVSVVHSDWILEIGNISIVDPGIPDVREYIIDVIEDVVSRYDVDGIHFDDYFYPYPPNQIDLEDLDSFNTYGGSMPLFDWRRDNINQFVRGVSDAIQAINPKVKFGISPFGIWKNDVPSGIIGMSAVDVIFADATEWLSQGWIDYLAPQLYWPFGGGQDFGSLAPWWVSVSGGRHIYPGLGAYRSDRAEYSGELYSFSEIPNQIRFTRSEDGIDGNILFRAENITRYFSNGLSDSLSSNLYRNIAIPPVMVGWREMFLPDPPEDLSIAVPTKKGIGITWNPPSGGLVSPRKYAVYRTQSGIAPDPRAVSNDPANLLAVAYDTFYNDEPPVSPEPYWYLVTSLSANNVESDESEMAEFVATGTATESIVSHPFELQSVAPNPAGSDITVYFSLDKPGDVTLRVYDLLGREAAILIEQTSYPSGEHRLEWALQNQARRRLSTGTYFVVLQVNDRLVGKPLVIVR